jgi:hypothetical protein
MSDEGYYIRTQIVSLLYVKAVLYKRTIQQNYFDKETFAMNNEELPALSAETKKVLQELANELKECDIDFWQLNEVKKIQLILDSTTIGKTRKTTSASAHRVEHLTQRLIFQLHITRYRGILDQK